MTMSNKKKGSLVAAVVAIIASTVAIEGGYVNNPKDPGGETNHGITVEVARKYDYTGPMKEMPREFAEHIYFKDYIEKPGYLPIVELSHAVGEELVDSAVNAGPGRSSRWFQTALNSLNRGGKDFPTILVDGRVGAGTVNSYKSLEKIRGKVLACQLVIKLMDAQQAAHYMSLTHLNTFTPGWVANRIGNVPLNRCSE
jgi:lysozyme family protein